MRFQNATSIDQVLAWPDKINRRAVTIAAGAVVEGDQYREWCRPSGPLLPLAEEEAPHRRTFKRIDKSNLRETLEPIFQIALRSETKGRQGTSLRWAHQAARIVGSDDLFSKFFDVEACVMVVNAVDLERDDISAIIGMMVERGVMRPSPHVPSETPTTAAIMGNGVMAGGWRRWAKSTLQGVDEGFSFERPMVNRSAVDDAGDSEDMNEWKGFFSHRVQIENALATTILRFIENR